MQMTNTHLTMKIKNYEAAALSAAHAGDLLKEELAQAYQDLTISRTIEERTYALVVELRSALCQLQVRHERLIQELKDQA